jgi:hypothetical protein
VPQLEIREVSGLDEFSFKCMLCLLLDCKNHPFSSLFTMILPKIFGLSCFNSSIFSHICGAEVSSHYLHEKLIPIFLLEIGSVIKHQLVSHLTLGIALRGVLDALRKNIDSKVWLLSLLSVNSIIQCCTSNGMMVADVYIRYNSAGAV